MAVGGGWRDSRHDVREVTPVAYDYVLRAVRAELGAKPVQDLARWDVEKLITDLQARGVGHRGIVYTLGGCPSGACVRGR